MILARYLILVALVGACSCRQGPESEKKKPATTTLFRQGQVWSLHKAPSEFPNAAIKIIRIDPDPEVGPVIYVSVTGAQIRKSQGDYFFLSFSDEALTRSVLGLIREDANLSEIEATDFQYVYAQVRQGINSGKLGKCFTNTVVEVLERSRKADIEEHRKARETAAKKWPWWKLW